MKISELKHLIINIRRQVDELSSRVKMTGQNIVNMRTDQQNLLSLNNKEKVDLKKKKQPNNKEQSLQDLRSNIQVFGMPEGKGRASGAGKAFKEIMAKNFPDWKKPTNLQIQETE